MLRACYAVMTLRYFPPPAEWTSLHQIPCDLCENVSGAILQLKKPPIQTDLSSHSRLTRINSKADSIWSPKMTAFWPCRTKRKSAHFKQELTRVTIWERLSWCSQFTNLWLVMLRCRWWTFHTCQVTPRVYLSMPKLTNVALWMWVTQGICQKVTDSELTRSNNTTAVNTH